MPSDATLLIIKKVARVLWGFLMVSTFALAAAWAVVASGVQMNPHEGPLRPYTALIDPSGKVVIVTHQKAESTPYSAYRQATPSEWVAYFDSTREARLARLRGRWLWGLGPFALVMTVEVWLRSRRRKEHASA